MAETKVGVTSFDRLGLSKRRLRRGRTRCAYVKAPEARLSWDSCSGTYEHSTGSELGGQVIPAIIQDAVWLYHRFRLSHRDIDDPLAERGVEVSCESVRLWCNKFGPHFSRRLRRTHPGFDDMLFIDEVFVQLAGQRPYLWRAVDQDGEVVDVYLQTWRDAEAATRVFRRLLRSHGKSPWKIVSDKLGSYGVARRELMPAAIHDTGRYANNRAELPHQPTRARERGMRRFRSPAQAQRFPSAHAVVYSLFNLQRQML